MRQEMGHPYQCGSKGEVIKWDTGVGYVEMGMFNFLGGINMEVG